MASIVTRIELEVEELVQHVRDMLTKNPAAEIHINPPKDSTIKVGTDHPNTAASPPKGPH